MTGAAAGAGAGAGAGAAAGRAVPGSSVERLPNTAAVSSRA